MKNNRQSHRQLARWVCRWLTSQPTGQGFTKMTFGWPVFHLLESSNLFSLTWILKLATEGFAVCGGSYTGVHAGSLHEVPHLGHGLTYSSGRGEWIDLLLQRESMLLEASLPAPLKTKETSFVWFLPTTWSWEKKTIYAIPATNDFNVGSR